MCIKIYQVIDGLFQTGLSNGTESEAASKAGVATLQQSPVAPIELKKAS